MLQIIQAAASEMGLPIPSTVAGNTAIDAQQMLGLLNSVGRELYTGYEWQALAVPYRFYTTFLATTGNITNGSAVITNIPSTSTLSTDYMLTGTGVPQDCNLLSIDSATQVTMDQPMQATTVGATLNFCKTAYSMPADYRKPINNTQWDKTRHWVMLGPASPQMWEWLKSGYIATGPRIHWRILGNKFQIWPMITATEYLGFEYTSTSWVYTSANVAQSSFINDNDTSIFQDQLLISALKLKYFSVKGFDTTDYAMEYGSVLSSILATEKGARTLRMSGRSENILINMSNVPDSGYGA